MHQSVAIPGIKSPNFLGITSPGPSPVGRGIPSPYFTPFDHFGILTAPSLYEILDMPLHKTDLAPSE